MKPIYTHNMLAQIQNDVIDSSIGNVQNFSTPSIVVERYVGLFVKLLLIGGSVALIFMLLIGSFEYITAGGDKERTGNASKRITNALVGLTILFATFAVTALINTIFKIDLLNLTLPKI